MDHHNFALVHASVWDGGESWLADQTVVVERGHVVALGPFYETAVHAGHRVVDVSNQFLLPGLADLHVHLTTNSDPCRIMESAVYRGLVSKPAKLLHGIRNSWKALSAGFTTLRVMGHRDVGEVDYRRFVDDGLLPGPRMIVAPWWISMTAGHGDLFYPTEIQRQEFDTADGPDECRKLVRLQVRQGADFIKVMASGGVLSHGDKAHWPNYTPSELSAIVEEARDLDLKVAAHAHSAEGIRRAVLAGADTIEHGSFMEDDCLELMRDHGTVLVPTLSITDWLSREGSARGVPADQLARLAVARKAQLSTVARAREAGVPIAMGTDSSGTLCPFGEHGRELELYVECGMTPGEALGTATTVAAKVLGREGELGVVAVGAVADFVLLSEDPLKDIGAIRHSVLRVFKEGHDVTDMRDRLGDEASTGAV